jgi:adenylate cyclase
MGADEEGTLERLKAHRAELIDPAIAAHHGRIVKTTGDGLLAEFASAVDAVRCAAEVQGGLAERNDALLPQQRIVFRIGIHIGDVIIEGDDIYGDGVNIAARLEGAADPGGVLVSHAVHDQVRDRLDLGFEDLGQRELKNIARPVRVYRLAAVGEPEAAELPLPAKPSIAVLPFSNMSGDGEQEYFADGMAEDIITGLSRLRWLFVIARNSSFAYKGRSVDVRQVGRELGVRYVLEGSVRTSGHRIRVTAQLVEAETGNHLWADRYDRALEDVFAVQDEITESVIGSIQPEVYAAEHDRVKRKPPQSLDAWEGFLRAVFLYSEHSDASTGRRARPRLRASPRPACGLRCVARVPGLGRSRSGLRRRGCRGRPRRCARPARAVGLPCPWLHCRCTVARSGGGSRFQPRNRPQPQLRVRARPAGGCSCLWQPA